MIAKREHHSIFSWSLTFPLPNIRSRRHVELKVLQAIQSLYLIQTFQLVETVPVSHGVDRLVAFANRDRDLLFAAAATDAELHGLIGCDFRHEPIEFSHTRYTIVLKPDDNIIFSQPRFFRWTVFDYLSDGHSARVPQSVARHVFLVYVFRVNTQETATANKQ